MKEVHKRLDVEKSFRYIQKKYCFTCDCNFLGGNSIPKSAVKKVVKKKVKAMDIHKEKKPDYSWIKSKEKEEEPIVIANYKDENPFKTW